MRETRLIMGMPAEVRIPQGDAAALAAVFNYFTAVDERFSTYKESSEISKINRGQLAKEEWSGPMREVFALSEETARDTNGYFSITRPDGSIDPSGLVKGWAIRSAARLIESLGYGDYFLNVGGDIQSRGVGEAGSPWTVGIRNPFKREEIVKVLIPRGHGIATSGSYIRGDHIYNPHQPHQPIREIVSLTIIGPDVYEADRFATAAFAMGKEGINFIESAPGLEGYMIDAQGTATITSGLHSFLA